MNQILRPFYVPAIAFVLLLSPRSAFAACGCDGSGLCNPLAFCTIQEFLVAILNVAVAIATPLIILFIVYIGFRFVQESAAGNAEKIKELRGLLMWALIGGVIVLSAHGISLAIKATVDSLTG